MGIGKSLPSGVKMLPFTITMYNNSPEQQSLNNLEFLALPGLLAHSGLIQIPAMIMSIVGGLLIYGTIISFTMFFREEQDF